MTTDEIKEKVRSFLLKFIKNHDLKDDEDLFASRLLNSLFAMQLVLFVEKEFTIKIENQDLDIKNFSSVNAISGLIDRKVA